MKNENASVTRAGRIRILINVIILMSVTF